METKSGRIASERRINTKADATHPYTTFEGSDLWNVLDTAINALVKNGDISEATRHEYIVGYLAKTLNDSKWNPTTKTEPPK